MIASPLGTWGIRSRPVQNAARHQRQFAQSADGLDPAKALLDTFANLQAYRVALATGGAMVDGAAPTCGVAGNVGLDPGAATKSCVS